MADSSSNLKTTGLDELPLEDNRSTTSSNVSTTDKPHHSRRKKQSTAQTIIGDDVDEDVESFFHGSDAGQEGEKKGHHQPQQPLTWGRGIRKDWNTTTGAHWWTEMTNFHQKTIPVTL